MLNWKPDSSEPSILCALTSIKRTTPSRGDAEFFIYCPHWDRTDFSVSANAPLMAEHESVSMDNLEAAKQWCEARYTEALGVAASR